MTITTLALTATLLTLLATAAWHLTARWIITSIDWTGPLTHGPPTPPNPFTELGKALGHLGHTWACYTAAFQALSEAFNAALNQDTDQ